MLLCAYGHSDRHPSRRPREFRFGEWVCHEYIQVFLVFSAFSLAFAHEAVTVSYVIDGDTIIGLIAGAA
jgi:hypothetical protein